MALFAKSKVERFEVEPNMSTIDFGISKAAAFRARAGLGFTADKLPATRRGEMNPEETGPTFISAQNKRLSAGFATRRSGAGRHRPGSNLVVSRLRKVEAEQQGKQLAWSEREREKLQAEVFKLRKREVPNTNYN